MDVKMQMGYLLECCESDRMPEAYPLIGKSSINGTGNAYECCPKRGPIFPVQITDIVDVLSGDNQGVSRVELPRIDGTP